MDGEISFEELSSNEQEQKLKTVMDQIKVLQRAEVMSGDIDIADISFFRLPSGEAAYDVSINTPDNTLGHIYYQEESSTLSRIDVESTALEVDSIRSQLALYQNSGMDLTNVNNELMMKERFLESIKNSEKISLSNLEEIRQQYVDLALQLGIDVNEIQALMLVKGDEELQLPMLSPEDISRIEEEARIAELDENDIQNHIRIDKGSASLDAKAFNMSGVQSSEIKGNDKVTTNYSFNQILGLNFESYRILITKSGSPVIVGITKDGAAQVIPEGIVEVNNKENNTMSLIRDDGSIKNVGVIFSLRVKSAGSSIEQDQAIGLYSDNGRVDGFYARNANGSKMIGEELPSSVYTTERVHSEKILDTKENANIAPEAMEAAKATDDGCHSKVDNIVGNNYKDIQELATQIANEYDVPVEELLESVTKTQSHMNDTSLEEQLRAAAEEIDRNQRHEPSLEPGEKRFPN